MINVVLNLLFVVSIFAIAVAATSLSAPSPHGRPDPVTADKSDDKAQPSRAPIGSSIATPIGPTAWHVARRVVSPKAHADADAVVAKSGAAAQGATMQEFARYGDPVLDLRLTVRADTSASSTPPVRLEGVSGNGDLRFKLSFAPGAVALDEEVRGLLQVMAASTLADRPLTLWAATDLRQATARLATSRRLMALRDELSSAGIDAARIDLRITGGGTWPEAAPASVWLTSADQPASPVEAR
ncbi:MAG: hypothetical protein EOP37_26700 [Rubrivivax sp.]|nr:MAG: hypothetical protein EOP37_26700 [Rubrivivax sp.]